MRLADVSVTFGPQIPRTASGEEFASNFLWAGGGEVNRRRRAIDQFREAAAEVGREAFTGAAGQAGDRGHLFHGTPEWAHDICCGMEKIRGTRR